MNNAKVLLVDAHVGFCAFVERLLKPVGHQLHVAHSVNEGIRLLGRGFGDNDPYEVAILDLVFDNYRDGLQSPEKAGLLVLQAAVKVPFLEPIILTVLPAHEAAAEALEKGVFRYLLKGDPDIRGKLIETVRLAAETRQTFRNLERTNSH